MSRPRGAIRQALASSAWALASSSPQGGANWRDAAAHACVGFEAARQTWKDMVRSGELVRLQPVRVPHASRAMSLCAPAGMAAQQAAAAGAAEAVASAMRSWAEFE